MRAIQIRSHGGWEVLGISTLPDPQPGANEVLVRIKASVVNVLDAIVRMGDFPVAKDPPLILGEEATGTIEQDAPGRQAGEAVIVYGGGLGVFRDGTWADLVTVPATSLRRLPDSISFEEGAAVTNAGVTAYGALRTAELKAGDTLVVLGATGGVGSAGVQIGKAIGARVIGVVSTTGKAERILALGADHVLALSDARLAEQVRHITKGTGADVVLDTIGGEVTGQALSSLASFGRLVQVGYSAVTRLNIDSLDLISKLSTIVGFNIFLVPADRAPKDIDDVIAFVAQNKYRAVLDKNISHV